MLADPSNEVRTMSRSVLRHRPIAQTEPNKQVQTPRASQVRQKSEPYTPDDQTSGYRSTTRAPRHRTRGSWLLYLVLGMVMAMVLLWVGEMLLHWGNRVTDDIHYGRPRTTHADQFVGHETGNIKSHFVAMNLDGQIYVIEIPGGSPNTPHLLVGPRLIGEGTDLAPVSLSFPGDPQHPDLLLVVNGIQVSFHNTGSAYVPET